MAAGGDAASYAREFDIECCFSSDGDGVLFERTWACTTGTTLANARIGLSDSRTVPLRHYEVQVTEKTGP